MSRRSRFLIAVALLAAAIGCSISVASDLQTRDDRADTTTTSVPEDRSPSDVTDEVLAAVNASASEAVGDIASADAIAQLEKISRDRGGALGRTSYPCHDPAEQSNPDPLPEAEVTCPADVDGTLFHFDVYLVRTDTGWYVIGAREFHYA